MTDDAKFPCEKLPTKLERADENGNPRTTWVRLYSGKPVILNEIEVWAQHYKYIIDISNDRHKEPFKPQSWQNRLVSFYFNQVGQEESYIDVSAYNFDINPAKAGALI
jgi:hypothetical protein